MNAIAKGADEKFCSECGAVIKAKAEICPKCGVRQLTPNSRNKVAAALLAFFLGGFGVHRFYLGRSVSGFVYLLFFWTFIPAVLGFVETFRILLMSDLTFAQKYP